MLRKRPRYVEYSWSWRMWVYGMPWWLSVLILELCSWPLVPYTIVTGPLTTVDVARYGRS